MSKIIDLQRAQAALDRAARGGNRAGRFLLKRNLPNVKSSMMTRVDYDHDSGDLDIRFVGGKTYRYFDVPEDTYEELLDAESKGEFFNEHIKGKFDFREVIGKPRS
jgi:hypothetical protein